MREEFNFYKLSIRCDTGSDVKRASTLMLIDIIIEMADGFFCHSLNEDNLINY